MAKASKAQLMALAKFKQEKRDTLTIDLPKGTKDGYKQSAAILEMSLTKLIQAGVEEYIRNHAGEVPAVKLESEKLSAADKKLLEAFSKCPEHVKPALRKVIEELAKKGGGENGGD